MIAAIFLSLAAVGPPQIVTVGKCQWERPPAAVAAKPRPKAAATAASGVKPKPAKSRAKRVPKPPVPGDEFIGCDEDGPVFRSDLETIEPVLELVPPVAFERVEPVEPTFVEACDCESWFTGTGGGFSGFVGGGGGGGGGFVPERPPVTPIPEPETWLLILIGGAAVWRKTRRA